VSGRTLRTSGLGGRKDGPSGHGMAESGVAVGLWGWCFSAEDIACEAESLSDHRNTAT